ncbi:hypothetical protein AV530_014125 [Patagioenas fasciata monilis]|uniref:Uncharacterized protein n=1 Tax=Patagioenas fasciata monilis TaxID=372326 RepID=A0A1V4KD61_PATFA|nr:hypothetical protein AV530_014125 [Patagioenas fasciata monilis]
MEVWQSGLVPSAQPEAGQLGDSGTDPDPELQGITYSAGENKSSSSEVNGTAGINWISGSDMYYLLVQKLQENLFPAISDVNKHVGSCRLSSVRITRLLQTETLQVWHHDAERACPKGDFSWLSDAKNGSNGTT